MDTEATLHVEKHNLDTELNSLKHDRQSNTLRKLIHVVRLEGVRLNRKTGRNSETNS